LRRVLPVLFYCALITTHFELDSRNT
jgi:hypothetical protein